jgi:Ca2+-binding EF-hand superfamily protein
MWRPAIFTEADNSDGNINKNEIEKVFIGWPSTITTARLLSLFPLLPVKI